MPNTNAGELELLTQELKCVISETKNSNKKTITDKLMQFVIGVLVTGVVTLVSMVTTNDKRLAVIEDTRLTDTDVMSVVSPIYQKLEDLKVTSQSILTRLQTYEARQAENRISIESIRDKFYGFKDSGTK